MGGVSESDGPCLKINTAGLPCFLDFRLVFEGEFQSSYASGGIPEWLEFDDRGRQ